MKTSERCTNDIVLDTNVLCHADNAASPQHLGSQALLWWMLGSRAKWVLDDQGKSQPNPLTSILYSEYRSSLAPQGFALNVFVRCLGTDRVTFARRPCHADQQAIRKLVPRKASDRAVLGAAIATMDRLLVSNDLDDFDENVRLAASSNWCVAIVEASELDSSA